MNNYFASQSTLNIPDTQVPPICDIPEVPILESISTNEQEALKLLKGQSQLSISFGVEIAKLLALVQNYLVSNQNTGSYRIVPKINFVFYRKGSAEP